MDDRKMIYLDDALDAVSEACFEFRGVFGRCEDALKALPPAQPEYTIEMQESDIDEAMKLVRDARVTILPSAQPEQPTEVQDILQYLDEYLHPIVSPEHWSVYSELYDMVSMLSPAQSEIIRCKDCKWCEEHYDTDGNAPYWIL